MAQIILSSRVMSTRRGSRTMSAGVVPLLDVTDDGGVAVMTLQRPPVNGLNLEILQTISKSLDEVDKNKPKGMILTSASSNIFSAGIDISEIYKPHRKRAQQFWTSFQDVWTKLYGFKFPTAAAINGHALAGGCLLAISCEYRAMVGGNYTIGANDVALGIDIPRWAIDVMCRTIGTRNTELALTTAKLFSVEEAFKVGLIDEVASDKSNAMEKCKNFINAFDEIPLHARPMSKLKMRKGPLNYMNRYRQQDSAEFLAGLENPLVQETLEKYVKKGKPSRSSTVLKNREVQDFDSPELEPEIPSSIRV